METIKLTVSTFFEQWTAFHWLHFIIQRASNWNNWSSPWVRFGYRWTITLWRATVGLNTMQSRIQKKTKKGKTLQPWALMSLDFQVFLSLFFFKKRKTNTRNILCRVILFCTFPEIQGVGHKKKSSSRGKVSLQCSRSGKTIRWNGREETRSKLFPLFFFFSLHHFREGLGLGGLYPPWSVPAITAGKEAMTSGLGRCLCTAHASGRHRVTRSCKKCLSVVYLIYLSCVWVFPCFDLRITNTAYFKHWNKSPTATKINTTRLNSINSPNRSYQELCVWLLWIMYTGYTTAWGEKLPRGVRQSLVKQWARNRIRSFI